MSCRIVSSHVILCVTNLDPLIQRVRPLRTLGSYDSLETHPRTIDGTLAREEEGVVCPAAGGAAEEWCDHGDLLLSYVSHC